MFSSNSSGSELGMASLEVAVILIGSFLLGYILSYEINKNRFKSKVLSDSLQHNEFDTLHTSDAKNSSLTPIEQVAHDLEQPSDDQAEHNSVAARIAATPPAFKKTNSFNEHKRREFSERTEKLINPDALQLDNTLLKSKPLDSSVKPTGMDSDASFLDEIRRDLDKLKNAIRPHEDLTLVHGITQEVEQLLNENGIYNYEQLSCCNIFELKSWITATNIEAHYMESWPRQARYANHQQWQNLKTFQHEISLG